MSKLVAKMKELDDTEAMSPLLVCPQAGGQIGMTVSTHKQKNKVMQQTLKMHRTHFAFNFLTEVN